MNDTPTDRPNAAAQELPDEPGHGRTDAAQEAAPSSADRSPAEVVSGAEALAMADPARVRRAPRFGRIGVLSALIGLLVCAVVTIVFAEPTEFLSLPGVFLLIAVFTVPVFVFAGCGIALLLDARSRRHQAQRRQGQRRRRR